MAADTAAAATAPDNIAAADTDAEADADVGIAMDAHDVDAGNKTPNTAGDTTSASPFTQMLSDLPVEAVRLLKQKLKMTEETAVQKNAHETAEAAAKTRDAEQEVEALRLQLKSESVEATQARNAAIAKAAAKERHKTKKARNAAAEARAETLRLREELKATSDAQAKAAAERDEVKAAAEVRVPTSWTRVNNLSASAETSARVPVALESEEADWILQQLMKTIQEKIVLVSATRIEVSVSAVDRSNLVMPVYKPGI